MLLAKKLRFREESASEDIQQSNRCFGKDTSWKYKIPFIVLTFTMLLSLISFLYFKRSVFEFPSIKRVVRTSHRGSEGSNSEDREIFNIKTSYVPAVSTPYDPIKDSQLQRRKREMVYSDNQPSQKYGQGWRPNSMNHKNKNSLMYDRDTEFIYWGDKITRDSIREKQAQIILQYMNVDVNPCSDFYEFTCGNWDKYNAVPPDKVAYDTFEKLREKLDRVLRDLLLEEGSDDTENLQGNSSTVLDRHLNPFIKAKNLYKSCINEETINIRAEIPLLILLKKLGGWPVIDCRWNETQFDWLWLITQLRLFNNDILISYWIGTDIASSKRYIIQIDQTTLGLPSRDYFVDEANIKYLEAYRVYLITAANILGAPIVKAIQDADKIIDFETNLAKIAIQYEHSNLTDAYSRMTLGQLQVRVPQINWLRYVNLIMEEEIGPNEPIICFALTYLQNLVQLLSITPSRTIANYILWRFVRHRMDNLDSRFLEAKKRFQFILYGREELPPRWQMCVSQVNSNMGMSLGYMFIKKYYNEKSKNDTTIMTKNIQRAFYSIIRDVRWLDEETKKLALQKLEDMQLRIGYPDHILDTAGLIRKYKDLEINENLYFENILNILQHLARSEQLRLRDVVNKTIWNTPPATVNAYYSRNKNQIMFPAGLLQPPFYHRYFPRSLNYGGIGIAIGHEITHGFDDKGRMFDKDGNLRQWWNDMAIDAFHDRAQCLIDQYNSYIVPEIGEAIDGVNTQGENIADNGGIKQAFNAYKLWRSTNPDVDETLPGIDMSDDQLFFVNFAQIWCGVSRPETLRSKLKSAIHSPGRFRVIGAVTNFPEFSRAFRCPMGSPMNPKRKCRIW